MLTELAAAPAEVPEIGDGDRAWPRAGASSHKMSPLALAEVARLVLERARDELDERVFVRFRGERLVDVGLGVRWAPRGSSWRPLGRTCELLAGEPAVDALAARVEAALLARGSSS
jgi:hypothetical protein